MDLSFLGKSAEQTLTLQGFGGQVHADDEKKKEKEKYAFYTNENCSGRAAAWISLELTLAIIVLSKAAKLWKYAKHIFKATPAGWAVQIAIGVVLGILTALGVVSGYFAVKKGAKCWSVQYKDFF